MLHNAATAVVLTSCAIECQTPTALLGGVHLQADGTTSTDIALGVYVREEQQMPWSVPHLSWFSTAVVVPPVVWPLGKASSDQAIMLTVKAVGIVIFRQPAQQGSV